MVKHKNTLLCVSYNTGKSALPDIYARCPRARSTSAYVITNIYHFQHQNLSEILFEDIFDDL